MRDLHIATLGADTFFVRIDSFNEGVMKGVVDSVIMSAPCEFNSLIHLILMVDNILDQQEENPKSQLRKIDASFNPTMELEVAFRQNHTWQGQVRYQAGQKQAKFRSVLELIVILEMLFS